MKLLSKGGFLTIFLSLLVGLFLGFFVGSNFKKSPTMVSISQENTLIKNDLFDKQSAMLEGTVLDFNAEFLTIKNSRYPQAKVPIGPDLKVRKFDPKVKKASESAGVSGLEKNKAARIYFDLIDGEYKVVSVSYL